MAQRSRRVAREGHGLALPAGRTWECDSQRELLPEVHDEVARLPEKYRVPIVLCCVEGLTHEEAAGQLHLPVGTVKVRLARGQLGRVDRGGCPPRPPTDPGLHITRTRFLIS